MWSNSARSRFGLLLVLVALCAVVVPASAAGPEAQECTPGDQGCLPTKQQCASGGYDGYHSGGSNGRFAICLSAGGTALVYAGGTVTPGTPTTPACGAVSAAGQDLVPGDPNSCSPRAPAGSDLAGQLASLGLDACSTGTWNLPDGSVFPYGSCVGEIRTFDGIGIDARVTFPAGASGPLPTVLLLHGWSGTRVAWQQDSTPDAWSRMRFVTRGYATVATTARGFYASCGQFNTLSDDDAAGGPATLDADASSCLKGWTHIAERAYEVRDSQHVLGRLVDAGVSDARRLAATGESYGAGQSWALATSVPWDTPADGERRIRLAAAVPFYGWTDLLDGLAPNGRATDGKDQRASHEAPFGVSKSSWFSFLYQAGRVYTPNPNAPQRAFTTGRYNTADPSETHSFLDGWAAQFSAGEPYDTPAGAQLAHAFRGKSAYYATDYLRALRSRKVAPVPVFAVQGWTDGLFPAVQALQMYRRLQAARRGYPLWLRLGDLGHGGRHPAGEMHQIHEEAGRFIDAALLGGDLAKLAGPRVASYATECVSTLPARVAGGTWDSLRKRPHTFTTDAAVRTTSLVQQPVESADTDPVVASVRGTGGTCVSAAGTPAGAWFTWDAENATLLGLPVVRATYALNGTDATLVAKVWDIAPDGTRTLVTRGVHRLSALGGDQRSGTVELRMFGNHWEFAPGHRLGLELTQTDAPFLRPDSLPSTVDWSAISLELPSARGGRP